MKTVLFVQLPPPRFSFETPPTNIHLAAGFMVAALGRFGTRHIETSVIEPQVVDVFADQGLLNFIVERRPTVVALTVYLWNVGRSLFLASQIKQNLPKTTIVLGGPEVTPDNQWVLEHPASDAGVFGEGESRIGPLIEAIVNSGGPRSIPGSFFRDKARLQVHQDCALEWDLTSSPYPYLDGKIGPSIDGTVFLETVRGCPYHCRYCYYHKSFAGVRRHPQESIKRVLDFAYDKDSPVREIYLMDPTFNAHEDFRALLTAMEFRRNQKDIALHAELRADLLDYHDAVLLKNAGLKSAEVGLQTVNPRALQMAGRKENIRKIARGVSLLKNEGIEVTTGIILGLPGDTPERFQDTLGWLKQTGAYSVVHPFILSILPGTDFRSHASFLGLRYDMRPPYYVRSTNTFSGNDLTAALHTCESVFNMELDHIGLPSLVDRGPEVIHSPERTRYISKWVIDSRRSDFTQSLSQVIAKATDPFIFWLRGCTGQRDRARFLQLLKEFVHCNPHTCMHIVIECAPLPSITFFQEIIDAVANPSHFLNRSYRPLYREDELVSPNFTLLAPDPDNQRSRERISSEYLRFANVVWDLTDPDENAVRFCETPVLISWSTEETERRIDDLWKILSKRDQDTIEGVYFRNSRLQAVWNRLQNDPRTSHRLAEKILVTL